jgi:DNA polymerase elongation subunit (family B)
MFYTNVFSRGNKIYLRGYKDGRRHFEKIDYKPYLFVPSDKDTKYKTLPLNNKPQKLVSRIDFDSITDAREFLQKYEDVSNFEIYGFTDWKFLFIRDKYPNIIDYDVSAINIISIDIETDSSSGFPDIEKADKEITAITLSRKGEKVVFGMKDYKVSGDKTTYIKCKDEWTLLNNFLKIWQSGRFLPDIITGWNIEFFDIPYIVNRIKNVLGLHEASKLSPWGFLDEKTIEIRGRQQKTYVPAGVNVLDYYNLYKKFKFETQESYKLDFIAEKELGVKKLDYSKYGSLHEMYVKDPQMFYDYNVHDVTLIDMLEEKLGFIELVLAFAYDAKVNYNDTLTTVRPWDVIIHNYLLDRNTVIPQFKKAQNYESLVGGHVKEPKLGMSKWVISFDLNSLYPHLIIQYNMSPETMIGREQFFPHIDSIVSGEALIEGEYSIAANGVKFSREKQGFLPALMQKMYNDRVLYKKKMIEAKQLLEATPKDDGDKRRSISNDIARYHNLQLAKKIQLNAAYGALGNEWFRWFNFDMAEAITMSGQLSIRWIERKMNEYLNNLLKTNKVDYVLASDTDSIYVNMEPIVNKLDTKDIQVIVSALDKFCEGPIQKMISASYKELSEYMNAYDQKMIMKRETIADKAIWRGKKMYILNALDVEGVRFSESQLKIQGIEAVRSSTPNACRSSIKEALKIIMNQDEAAVQNFIHDFKRKFMNLSVEEISFPRGVKGLFKYKDKNFIYGKGSPIHVKGALLFNEFIQRNELTNKYQLIGEGDKIKFCYLKQPNTIQDTVISYNEFLPKELMLHNYVDYEMQFNKAFLEPIKSILEVIGWDTETKSTLESFF